MIAARFAATALLLAAGCSTTTLPPPLEEGAAGGSASQADAFPAQVRLERPGMTCRASARAAKRGLKRMGYVVESVVPPEPGKTGEIRALRRTDSYTGESGDTYGVAVRLTCDDRGSVIEAATEEGFSKRLDFRRDFPLEFNRAETRAVARKSRQPQAAARKAEAKLQVFLQPLQDSAAVEILGGTPETLGITPVRIQIHNRSTLKYRLQLSRFKLISEEGERNRPMPINEVAAKVPGEWKAKVRARQIPDSDIAPGQTLDGYFFVPAAAYRRAKVVLIEAASEEAEGFSVEF